MNTFKTIALRDGSEWACNREGEGVFSRRADGTWQQHAETSQAGPFRNASALSRHVRKAYRDRDGRELPTMVRGSARGWVRGEAEIKIGHVVEEFTSEDDDGNPIFDDLDAYVRVSVEIDGCEVSVACGLGVPGSDQGSAVASGCGVTYGGGPDAWWVDYSDHQDVPEYLWDETLSALRRSGARLWRETMAKRPTCEREERT